MVPKGFKTITRPQMARAAATRKETHHGQSPRPSCPGNALGTKAVYQDINTQHHRHKGKQKPDPDEQKQAQQNQQYPQHQVQLIRGRAAPEIGRPRTTP